jgi:hypothetical protein
VTALALSRATAAIAWGGLERTRERIAEKHRPAKSRGARPTLQRRSLREPDFGFAGMRALLERCSLVKT